MNGYDHFNIYGILSKNKFNMSQDFDIFNDNIRQVCLYFYK